MEDDSFESVLAELDIPCEPKKAKIITPSKQKPVPVTQDITSNAQKKGGSAEPKASTSTTTVSPIKKSINPHHILVHPKQRGNPLLKTITNIPWEFDDIVPDYIVGPTSCILFLSLRYHNLNPDYIHNRLKLLGKSFELRVLLVQVDTKVSTIHYQYLHNYIII